MIIAIIIISLFLESIVSVLIPINSFFNPLFTLVSLVLIYPYFVNDNSKYIKYCAIIGLIYDLMFTNTLFFNLIMFIIIGYFIKLINITLSNNFINVVIITIINIIIYLLITYLILLIIGYKTFNVNYLMMIISKSLLLNGMYSFIGYLITDKISKKYKILKID